MIIIVKILMHGCNGTMGKVICALAENSDKVEIVAGIDLESRQCPFPVYADIMSCDMPADVIVDFSIASAVPDLLEYAKLKKIPVILCTTGLSEAHRQMVYDASNEIAVFQSANMSLGINLLINLVKKATDILAQSGFDIEIIDKHHNLKIDAPSGTAMAIADAVNSVLNNEYAYVFDRSQKREKRSQKEIGIHALRGGTIVGEHSVMFAGKDEVMEISHKAASKEVFAVGALKAAEFMADKTVGLYTMEDLIGL